ncbi:MAG: hypothetical protein R3342_04805 [Lutibacter sp.]|jgi:hypothetical protein|uniref:hypothetical protein n=1 Tax=Lutibacter sp. TaxID=1925666 RepID=UPI00299F3ADA|nr:hypothetical protein [Lutibacter sp.]MDX1828849.1 hypothetical protein [Lutibacter sp.]
MKNLFKLEILETNKTLTLEEQNDFRLKFKPLLKIAGIQSLCLEQNELYIEFDPIMFNKASFKHILNEMAFPLKLNKILV